MPRAPRPPAGPKPMMKLKSHLAGYCPCDLIGWPLLAFQLVVGRLRFQLFYRRSLRAHYLLDEGLDSQLAS